MCFGYLWRNMAIYLSTSNAISPQLLIHCFYAVRCTVYRSCGLFFKNFSARETILLVELNTLLLCSTLHGSFPPSEPIFSVKTWMFQTNSPKVFFSIIVDTVFIFKKIGFHSEASHIESS